MSRRLIILVVVLIGALALTISACSPVDLEGEQCTEHVWENEIVMGGASCTESGKALQRCSVCGKSQHVDIEPLGHDLVVKDNSGISATCEGEGFTGKLGCSRCDYQEEGTVIPALGHSWDEGRVTTAPTCEGTGVKTYTCLNDGSHTKTEEVSAVGHAYGEWIQGENGNHKKVCANDDSHVITEACSGGSNRCDELAICAVCGNAYGELKEHVYDQETIDDEYLKSGANCIFGAIYYKSCVCGAYDETLSETFEVGEPAGHNYENRDAEDKHLKAPATCESGAVYYTSCVCGEHDENLSGTFTFGDPLGHAYGAWEVITPATCEADGEEKRVCANDATHVETQPIDKLGHEYGDWEVVTPATCEADGEEKRVCANDATHFETQPIDKLGHEYGDWEVVTPATCTSEGEEKQVCANDATHVATRPISKLNHNHNIKSYQIIDGVLKLVRECACGTSQVLDDVDNTAIIAVSNASDLEAVLNGGGYAVILEDDITLDNGVITITKDATLYLNGKTITSNVAKITESVVGTKSVCDVFIVRGDVTFNINGDGKLLATHDEAETVCVLSALDGATVNIYGGEYVSSGCTTIYARTNSVINVFDGKFVAEDNSYGYLYTLDIWEGEEEEIWAEINVYGGEYVAFNPANHQGDGTYTNKLVEGVHSLLVEGAYIVSDHEYDDGVVTAPTCMAQGYTTYTCGCGHEIKDNYVDVDENAHAYGDWEVVTPATCDQDGEEKRVCAHNADHFGTQPIDKLGHDWQETGVVLEPTCTTEGTMGYECANDSAHTKTEPIAKIAHDIKDNGICANCPAKEVLKDLAVFEFGVGNKATGIDYSTALENYTETQNNYTLTLNNLVKTYFSKDSSGNYAIKLGTSGTAGSFSFTVPQEVKQIIIYAAKYKANTSTLEVNGKQYTLKNSSNDCLYDEIVIDTTTVKEITLTTVSDGYRAVINAIKYVAAGICEHENEKTTEHEVSCTTDGYIEHICEECGHTYKTDVENAPGHTEVIDEAEDPTCVDTGLTEGKHCSVCNEVLIAQTTIPANGHTDGEVKKENYEDADCEETDGGYDNVVRCTVCNEITSSEHVVIKAGHVDEDNDNECDRCHNTVCVHEGTWEVGENDIHTRVCTKCGTTETHEGHDYPETGVVTDPDCTNAGYTTYICKLCGGKDIRDEVEANGHTEVIDNAVAATCTESGLTEGKHCSVCNEVLVAQTEIPALGHDMIIGDCTTNSECQREGCDYEVAAPGHQFSNNICTVCGLQQSTVSVTISDYATANNWANGTKYPTISLDDYVEATASGSTNTGKYYTSGNEWRIYQTETPTITLTAKNGATLLSIKITYNISNSGVLVFNSNNITSATTIDVSGTSVQFGVGNTGTANNGQVKITAIEVVYTHKSCAHENTEEKEEVAPTCIEAGITAGTWCNDCESYISGGEEIPATGEHTYDETTGICTTDGCDAKNPEEGGDTPDEPSYVTTTTVSFADTTQRTSFSTSAQVWENGDVTFTNNKGSSTSNVADYSNPARFYKSSEIIIEANQITKIVFTADSNSYATELKNSIGTDATANGSEVTVEFDTPVDSYTIAKLTAQVRLKSIAVTYLVPAV